VAVVRMMMSQDIAEQPRNVPGRAQQARTALVYDPIMVRHVTNHEVESGARLLRIWQQLVDDGWTTVCQRIAARDVSHTELMAIHSPHHVDTVSKLTTLRAAWAWASPLESVEANEHTAACAYRAAGCACALVDWVLALDHPRVPADHAASPSAVPRQADQTIAIASSTSTLAADQASPFGWRNGFALVRPPGHHAEQHCAKGFCVFNNVAVAARRALDHHGLQRILIVDWDVHHGNGTQHVFYRDPRVLYFSVHRYDQGRFYPGSADAAPDCVGDGPGRGFNINVAWDEADMGDADYVHAWQTVLLPVARQWQPQLILVSAGFDAGVGDPLGRCRVTPQGYGRLTELLLTVCPRTALVLEGGYHLHGIAAAVAACVARLVNGTGKGGKAAAAAADATAQQEQEEASAGARQAVAATVAHLQPFWACLRSSSSLSSSTTALPPKPMDTAPTTAPPAFVNNDEVGQEGSSLAASRMTRHQQAWGSSCCCCVIL